MHFKMFQIMLLLALFVLLHNLSGISAHNSTQSELLTYLHKFGYLPNVSNVTDNNLNTAIRELQRIGNVYPSGQLDNQTLDLLERKRCGLADTEIVRMTHSDRPLLPAKRNGRLSYKVRNAPKTIKELELVRRIVYDAVQIWQGASNLEFFESNEQEADIEISFQTDTNYFDDQTIGRTVHEENKTYIYLNDQVNWTYYANKEELDLKPAIVHQLGHAAGLHHSDHPQSVMYPFFINDSRLHSYDITLIGRLYGLKTKAATNALRAETTPTLRTPTPSSITAKPPSNLPVDPCNSDVDAAELIDNNIFMFRNEKYWQFSFNGTLISRPRLIREYWPELLTWPVDAILEINGQILFFVGNQVLTFHNRRLKSTQNLTELGFPSDLTHVRLAYRWVYGDIMHFIWNATHYWKLDIRTMRPEVDYPRLISNIWKGVPPSVSAAFNWGNDLYFVDAGELYKFDSFKLEIARGFPRRFSHLLDYCMPRAEALTAPYSNVPSVSQLPKLSPLAFLLVFIQQLIVL